MEITSTETNNQDQTSSDNTLQITDRIKSDLKITSGWGEFLAVLGFIGSVFLAICSLIILVIGIAVPSVAAESGMPGISFTFMGVIYMALTVFTFLLTIYLYRFAKQAKKAITDNDQMSLETSMMYQRKLYKLYGIFTIVSFALAFVLVFVMAIAGAMAAM